MKYIQFDEGFLFKAYYWGKDDSYGKIAHTKTIIARNLSEAFKIANVNCLDYELFKVEEVLGPDIVISEEVFKSSYINNIKFNKQSFEYRFKKYL